MFTMWLDLSLCGMWYCEALVLLVGVFLQCRVLVLSRVYCIICIIYAAACSIRVVVYSTLLYDAVCRDLYTTRARMHIANPQVP